MRCAVRQPETRPTQAPTLAVEQIGAPVAVENVIATAAKDLVIAAHAKDDLPWQNGIDSSLS